jgi:transposase
MSLKPPKIEMDKQKIEGFLQRAEKSLDPDDFAFVSNLVGTLFFLSGLVEKKASAIARLLRLIFGLKTESSRQILNIEPADAARSERPPAKGHGRNGAAGYPGAMRVPVPNKDHKKGDQCPECLKGKLYPICPETLMRFFGNAPIQAVVYLLEKLRCNLCGQIFTAQKPAEAGEQKYDETAAAMVAVTKYGAGLPFNRLEKLQDNCGIPLPASTQWDMVNESAEKLKPAYTELVRQAAQSDVFFQDDTTSRVLSLNKGGEGDGRSKERKGVFTTGIVCKSEDKTIACFFTGHKHAGENLSDLLKQRFSELSTPIQMCDALSRNMPENLKSIICNCLTHGRRNFVVEINAFPEQARHVIEVLAKVYHHDAVTKEQCMPPEGRLRFHQEKSGPLMDGLKDWMETELRDKRIEPNSGMGKAFDYMLKRWDKLTRFLTVAGAPLDNNICERALKIAIRHRKNSLYYRTQRGAWVGDLFMSFIHTCSLMGVNAFDYTTVLLRNADKLADDPGRWMPWNYKQTLPEMPP